MSEGTVEDISPAAGPRTAHEVVVYTHGRPGQTAEALLDLLAAAREVGATLVFDEEETTKLGLSERTRARAEEAGLRLDAEPSEEVDLCIVLGGDGTILKALRRFACQPVPVFAVNFGQIGFLATIEPENLTDGLRRAFAGDYELLRLPGIEVQTPSGPQLAINDVSINRKAGDRVAQLAYSVSGEVIGSVRCDGLVIATPAGSTGYNLANGGPVMAWGTEGYVVSFIAPHSLTARALVVAPHDELSVENRSGAALDISVDGRPACDLPAGAQAGARFVGGVATIAQLPGANFYHRLRQKFGRLSE